MVSVEGTDPQKGETDHVGSVGKAEPWRGLSQFKMRGSLDTSQEQDLGRRDIYTICYLLLLELSSSYTVPCYAPTMCWVSVYSSWKTTGFLSVVQRLLTTVIFIKKAATFHIYKYIISSSTMQPSKKSGKPTGCHLVYWIPMVFLSETVIRL